MANWVTFARFLLLFVLLATAYSGVAALQLFNMPLVALIMSLDGVDGYVARRTGTVTERGARWDNAADASLIGVLALAVVRDAPWAPVGAALYPAYRLVRRLRQLHHVVGRVESTCDPSLAPFVEQKTALLTTFRRDGTPVPTPLSVAVDGDHAYVRTYEKAGKNKRLRNNRHVELAPSTTRGNPTGTPVPAAVAPARLRRRAGRRRPPFSPAILDRGSRRHAAPARTRRRIPRRG